MTYDAARRDLRVLMLPYPDGTKVDFTLHVGGQRDEHPLGHRHCP